MDHRKEFYMSLEFSPETEMSDIRPNSEQLQGLETTIDLECAELSHLTELTEASDLIAGTPEKDIENWHMQSETNSCAVSTQELVAEQLLGEDFSEQDFINFATEQGWYKSEIGTTVSDTGKLLEAVGLETKQEFNKTLSDLFGELKNGHKAIVGVNNMALDNPEFAELPGIQANHVVEVIGIDYSNPNDVQVILNDTGVPDGKGKHISADTFAKSWNTSNRFMVTAWKGAK